MTVLTVLVVSVLVLVGAGRFYSRFLARSVGEDPSRPMPALEKADGRDYVATPTPIVFAHHFASIAGAGPIVGPVLAMVYGWLPALIWVLAGGVLIGAAHDYLAAFMAVREGGLSVASVARRIVGADAFLALTLFLIVMLALVCATFLNLSAAALTSTVDMARLGLTDAGIFRTTPDGSRIVIGGIASMSVVVITAFAPLVGYLYIKRRVAPWKCSLLALGICAASIYVGLNWPVTLSARTWQLVLSAYCLLAAGAPVWLLLQSRDFINVHILYAGLAALVVVLVAAGLTNAHLPNLDRDLPEGASVKVDHLRSLGVKQTLQPVTVGAGEDITGHGQPGLGAIWPMLFITIACGAVSGFHSLCAGGTTCKQLTSERAVRRVGYYGMLLETFLAVCVIGVCMVGLEVLPYMKDVYPAYLAQPGKSNAVLGFAMALGWAGKLALGVPVVVGTLGGMVMLEGFLVTTLDTAVRLARYLIEEVWRAAFGRYDVLARPAGRVEAGEEKVEGAPAGSGGIPLRPGGVVSVPAGSPVPTRGAFRVLLRILGQYWFNSGLAVGLMLLFALTGGATALWDIFATSNQLLAAFVLALAAIWLVRQGRRAWFALLPGLAMLATTATSLVILLIYFLSDPRAHATLLVADLVIMVLTGYLLYAGVRAAVASLRSRRGLAGAPG